jgi:hypothetical protein
VTNANELNCTANDVRISRAINVSPASCVAGETFDLTATFQTIVTANVRYDVGFFFRTDGGANARGDGNTASGVCSLSALTPGVSPALPQSVDGDTCGDLNAGTYLLTFTIPDVLCQDTNGDGFLNLPNCTSWHSNAGTVCNISDQFTFQPDTKSKCVCDDNFQVPVIVETAALTVVKTASPTEVPETGQTVTYTVQITNEADFVSVTINTITDDIYGNLGLNTPPQTNNTCDDLIGTVLAPNGSTTCTFHVFVSGQSGTSITDTVEVCGTDSAGHTGICGEDPATVTISDVASTPALEKTATSAVTAACTLTVDATYLVGISNPSTVDTLTVNSLTDVPFGNITQAAGINCTAPCVVSTTCVTDSSAATCEVGGTIGPASSCSCTFVGRITQSGTVIGNTCAFSLDDTVTGSVTDDDGVTSSPSDSATVSVSATVNVSFP